MECPAVQSRLVLYLAGELPDEVAAAFRSHLEACPGCRARRAEEQRLNAILASPGLQDRLQAALPPPPPLPRHFTDQVMARVAAGAGRGPLAPAWRRWLAPAWRRWLARLSPPVGGAPAAGRLRNLAFAMSACLVASAGATQFLRTWLGQSLAPAGAALKGTWADLAVWAVERYTLIVNLIHLSSG